MSWDHIVLYHIISYHTTSSCRIITSSYHILSFNIIISSYQNGLTKLSRNFSIPVKNPGTAVGANLASSRPPKSVQEGLEIISSYQNGLTKLSQKFNMLVKIPGTGFGANWASYHIIISSYHITSYHIIQNVLKKQSRNFNVLVKIPGAAFGAK